MHNSLKLKTFIFPVWAFKERINDAVSRLEGISEKRNFPLIGFLVLCIFFDSIVHGIKYLELPSKEAVLDVQVIVSSLLTKYS